MFKHLKEQCFEFSASKGQGSLFFLGVYELYMFSGWGSRRSGGCFALLFSHTCSFLGVKAGVSSYES